MNHSIIDELKISPFLKSRINQRIKSTGKSGSITKPTSATFILYLPTVNLRIDQNPAFALACHIANHYEIPLVVLAVLLDDHSMPSSSDFYNSTKEVTMTARRLALLTEALSQSCKEWSDHGAGVCIRVHKPQARTPDHLTLSTRASVVVTDEPFVHPFLSFVNKVEKVCFQRSVPCFRVDGSTTVPPCSVLSRIQQRNNKRANSHTTKSSSNNMSANKSANVDADANVDVDNMIYYTGVPSKAWMWQKRTESFRNNQLEAAMNGDFDAPALVSRIDNDSFFLSINDDIKSNSDSDSKSNIDSNIDNNTNIDEHGDNHGGGNASKNNHAFSSSSIFPLQWRDVNNEAPGVRPWTVSELLNVPSIKQWAMEWPGSDSLVKPCDQTVGTSKAGMQRWNHWVSGRKGMIYYAKRRTDPLQPHASSRMSCYLNFGIVSIFRLVHEVKAAQKRKVSGSDKFEEEIVKWREMSYAHAFSRGDYNSPKVVPQWAQRWLLQSKSQSIGRKSYDLTCLEKCDSGDDVWDAMQRYLASTGELHNNVRMTWGKILVHWVHSDDSLRNSADPISNLLHVLCYLNDRYALDGLSPPSYAGLLWCIGWSDKPDRKGGISTKRRYKLAAPRFQDAESNLLNDKISQEQTTIISSFYSASSKRNCIDLSKDENESSPVKKKANTRSDKKTLHHFFGVG